jgi:carotenoid cleavage dioxygenase-like enzyme
VADPAFALGFQSLDSEVADRRLEVDGEVPGWLSGTLVRNGTGKFEAGGQRVTHWFDGLAMLRKYAFADGAVRYSNRFLRSEAYADAMAGRATGQFATDESGLRKLLGWVRRLGPPEATDNANVHVARLDGDLVALTEVPRWLTVDADSLNTTGEFAFDDDLSVHMTTAHLVADPHRGEHVGYGLRFGRTHEYRLFSIPDGSSRREPIGTVETDHPAYIHACAVTANYVILPETPLRIDILRALSPFTEGFFDLLSWGDDRESRLLVVDRESGELVATPAIDPVFVFHVANAFEDGDEVIVDLVDYADDTIVSALSLETLESAGFAAVPSGRLARYRFDMGGGDGVGSKADRERLYDGGIEMPGVAHERRTRRHRWVYGQLTHRKGGNGLVKVDTETSEATEWYREGVYVEEPRVVRRPSGETEDDGVVLAPALDVEEERAVLFVFDAATLDVLGRAPLPHHHPFGFHGRFFPDESMRA